MICTVTFNPSLDYIVSVDDFQLGMTNRTSSELILPGGKGINVSIVLKNLGLDSTALGYVAGFTGEELIRRLTDFGVNADFIKINHGMTRINLKLKSIDGTEINGCGRSGSAGRWLRACQNLPSVTCCRYSEGVIPLSCLKVRETFLMSENPSSEAASETLNPSPSSCVIFSMRTWMM